MDSTSSLNAPAIDFTGSSIKTSDDGHSTALFYLYDMDNRTLVPYGGIGNVASETARMVKVTSANDDVRLTLTPYHIGPSRNDDRFRLTTSAQRGRAKEFSALTLSFAQSNPMTKLNKPLSWSNTYSLTQMGNTQDVPDPTLIDQTQQGTLGLMPAPGGTGYLQVNFSTGQANEGFGERIDTILNIAKGIQSFDATKPLTLLSSEIDAAVTALKLLGNLFTLVPGSPSVTVDLSTHQGRLAYLNPMATGVDQPDVLRLPGGNAVFFVVPERDEATVQQILADAATNKQYVQFDPQTGRPFLSTDKAGNAPVPRLDPNDPNKVGVWQKCSVFVIATSVEVVAS